MYTMHEMNEFWSKPYVFLQVCSVIVWLDVEWKMIGNDYTLKPWVKIKQT